MSQVNETEISHSKFIHLIQKKSFKWALNWTKFLSDKILRSIAEEKVDLAYPFLLESQLTPVTDKLG